MDMQQQHLKCDESLVGWLLQTKPNTEDETSEMGRLFALRGRIDGQINTLVKLRIVLSTFDLAAQTAALGELTHQIDATARQIAQIKDVAAIAAEVVALVAAVIALVV